MDFEIRRDRKPQGPRALVRGWEEYFRLMDQGFSPREAARLVGIDVRTGKRRRNGHHSPGQGRKPMPAFHREQAGQTADPEGRTWSS
ncbi:hypothetical protein HNR30_007075 [Nonomuraea soli]|uniref:Helix-turn-helix domain-containing protein n=1 Tax=Nonomuraea soli TaxID=1032476 RepID=A0A7W0HU17_9ACTN|nr:hypothetical protein [Nonomuraea soli]